LALGDMEKAKAIAAKIIAMHAQPDVFAIAM